MLQIWFWSTTIDENGKVQKVAEYKCIYEPYN